MADPLIGTTIGEFEIHELIGRGGMATVYRASQASMKREVALKVIRMDDLENNQEFTQRFATEAKLIAGLEHPNILPVYSYGIDGDIAYLAMRLLRGGSLEEKLMGEPLSLQKAGEIFLQITQGLAAAHNKGVIHRDLKPSNILLDENEHVYLTDFGLAKLVDSEGYQTKTGQIVGTPVYMSPEQLRGEPLDFRSDVYALGCMLYEMLTGAPPFPVLDGDVIPVIFKHLQSPPEPVSQRNRNVPPVVEAVVMKALAKDRNERYDSVRSMANALADAVGRGSTLSLPRPASVILNISRTDLQPNKHNNPLPVIIATLLVVAAVAAVVVLVVFRPFEALEPLPPITVKLGESRPLAEFNVANVNRQFIERRLGPDGFVAIVPCNTSSEYHSALTRELTTFARAARIPTRVYDPDSDPYKQLTQLERALADGATGIIICPLDIALLSATLQAAEDNGIPLISSASALGQYNGVGILTDNYLMGLRPGQYAGQWIQENLGGQAKVVVLHYDELPDVKRRADGLIDGMKEFAPDAEIVAREIGAVIELAEGSIQRLIDSNVQFDIILSINDAGGYGAIAAMEKAGIPRDAVHIFSVDAEQRAIQYIREGRYFVASVDAGRTVYAQAAVDAMQLLLAGEPLPEILTIEPGHLVTREWLEQNANAQP
jgi:serine/threonine protein kinase